LQLFWRNYIWEQHRQQKLLILATIKLSVKQKLKILSN